MTTEPTELRNLLQDVLERDAYFAQSGMPNDCGCPWLSSVADREYEQGICPHQRARAALLAANHARPSPDAGQLVQRILEVIDRSASLSTSAELAEAIVAELLDLPADYWRLKVGSNAAQAEAVDVMIKPDKDFCVLMQSSSCFGGEVCSTPPCACAQSLIDRSLVLFMERLRDHYWDSLSQHRDLIFRHIHGALR